MTFVHSFAPIANAGANRLILGSMPGKASLQAQQYYAHKRNAFWPIMQELFNVDTDLEYEKRCSLLMQNGVAVWDVLKTCSRSSSLDSDIVESSIVTNNFVNFFSQYSKISVIFFNGAKAEQSFSRYVLPKLETKQQNIKRIKLLSTSPANAGKNFDEKLRNWQKVKNAVC